MWWGKSLTGGQASAEVVAGVGSRGSQADFMGGGVGGGGSGDSGTP